MKLNKNNAGLQAEQIAETFLRKQGLKHIASNYHCRYGEIDLIMQDKKTLVFCEVRLRTSEQFGGAAASVTYQKQQKLIKTAQHYLQSNNCSSACRFDVVLLNKAALTAQNAENITWIADAFGA